MSMSIRTRTTMMSMIAALGGGSAQPFEVRAYPMESARCWRKPPRRGLGRVSSGMTGSELRRRGLAWAGDGVKGDDTRQMHAAYRRQQRDDARLRLMGAGFSPTRMRDRSGPGSPSWQDLVAVADRWIPR